MPEGDTVFKLAAYLGPALQGRELRAGSCLAARDGAPPAALAGRRVGDVYAHGKHLFIELDGGAMLRSHLGMWGSWHAYAPDEAWRKPTAQAAIVLDIGERLFVCFNPLQVELLRAAGVRRRQLGRLLGPDLLADAPDLATMCRRARQIAAASIPVADVLLDQRIATGIGNVYKSEVLFLDRRHPLTPLGHLDDGELAALYTAAAGLLRSNVGRGPRVTRRAADEAGILWVYGRTAQPCLQCDAPIASARLGRRQRSTFWCPRCQPEDAVRS